MTYKAMRGTLILSAKEAERIEQRDSGLLIANAKDAGSTEIATVLSAGEDCGDITDGSKILYQTNTGFRLEKGIFYLKYEDVIAIIED